MPSFNGVKKLQHNGIFFPPVLIKIHAHNIIRGTPLSSTMRS
jgi:hypothetical protein